MNSSDEFKDNEFEQLNDAILKAIVSSNDVEKVLMDFKSKDLINEMGVVNLILSLEELSELMISKLPEKTIPTMQSSKENQTNEKVSSKHEPVASTQDLIDGRALSRNEILFEKYYQGRFDENRWLKRAKIKTVRNQQSTS